MAYDRAWDETFPADTQLANLLGQDVRNTKIDIRERVASFGADVLANRPTPEAVFVGVVFFATDTGLMYRWNGSSWVDITADFFGAATILKSSGTLVDISASAAPGAGYLLRATDGTHATWQNYINEQSASGYIRIGAFLLQWGALVMTGGSPQSQLFNIAFSSTPASLILTTHDTSSPIGAVAWYSGLDQNGFQCHAYDTSYFGVVGVSWAAFGPA